MSIVLNLDNLSTAIKSIFLLLLILIPLSLFVAYKYSSFTKQGFIHQYTLTYPKETPKSHTANPALALAAEARLKSQITYDPRYFEIDYPMGDVPSDKGVCTDVVIRSYRALGIDLQELVHEDMQKNFFAYPKMWRHLSPDPNIDHRRVPNLMTFFKRHGVVLSKTYNAEEYLPGDIVCWNLGGGIMHIGLVSQTKALYDDTYMIVHNIGAGPQLENVLFSWEIIGHYQFPAKTEAGVQ